MQITVFDLETRLNAQDIGWSRLKSEGGIAVAAALTGEFLISGKSALVHEPRISVFDEHTIRGLAATLEDSDLVVSFNGIAFDLPLLSSTLGVNLRVCRHYDIRQEIASVVGQFTKGYSLAALAERILGRQKAIGSHCLAPLVEENRWAELFQHAIDDVYLTYDLFVVLLANDGELEDGVVLKNPKEVFDG